MVSNRLALAALATACIGAAGAGGYLATRHNVASMAAPEAAAASATATSKPVQETEASVSTAAKPDAAASQTSAAATSAASPSRSSRKQADRAGIASPVDATITQAGGVSITAIRSHPCWIGPGRAERSRQHPHRQRLQRKPRHHPSRAPTIIRKTHRTLRNRRPKRFRNSSSPPIRSSDCRPTPRLVARGRALKIASRLAWFATFALAARSPFRLARVRLEPLSSSIAAENSRSEPVWGSGSRRW